MAYGHVPNEDVKLCAATAAAVRHSSRDDPAASAPAGNDAPVEAESLTRRRAASTAGVQVFLLMRRFNFTADMSGGGM